MATLINNIIFPMTCIEEHGPGVEAEPSDTTSAMACSSAEEFFMDARSQVVTGRDNNQYQISVYHDALGKPLIFRKRFDESSGLTLVPLNVGGITIPAGTIVGVDRSMNYDKMTGRKIRTHGVIATYVTEYPVRVLPLRVSAWAFEKPLDRVLFATGGNNKNRRYDSDKGPAVQATTIDHFRKAAEKVMRICGTTV